MFRKIFVISMLIFPLLISAFELRTINDLTGQRRDGSRLFDITYELYDMAPTDSVNIFVYAVTQSGETLAFCTPHTTWGTFSGDTGTVFGPDTFHILWNIGLDQPEREFYSDSIVIHLAAGMSGWEPDNCPSCTALGGTGNEEGKSVVQTSDGGFALAGFTSGFGAGDADLFLVKFSSSGAVEWSEAVGGTNLDWSHSVVQTSDGGFAVAGATTSFGAGWEDLFLVKFSSSGVVEWSKAVGGTSNDYGYSVVQTADGGFAVAGVTYSFGTGDADLLLVKFSSAGAVEWSRAVGGTSEEEGVSVAQTADGGFALAGFTSSFGAGYYDLFLVKFSSAGAVEWAKAVGGTYYDQGSSVVQTSDGGCAVAGYTWSFGAGDKDLFLVKFSSSGAVEWSRAVGGTSEDISYTVVQTADAGFALAGATYSFGAGDWDLFLVKFSSSGAVEWSRAVGGTNHDWGRSVVQTNDGGFAVAGRTNSFGAGDRDFFLVKFGPSGETCCGEEVFPTVTIVTPSVASPSPSVASPSPTVTVVSPTVTVVSPTVTEICP